MSRRVAKSFQAEPQQQQLRFGLEGDVIFAAAVAEQQKELQEKPRPALHPAHHVYVRESHVCHLLITAVPLIIFMFIIGHGLVSTI